MSARPKAYPPEGHLVRTAVTAPLVPAHADDYVLRHESRILSPARAGEAEERVVATARWDLLRLALAHRDRVDPYQVVGGEAELVYALSAAGEAAAASPEGAEGPGDVLYFRSVEVAERGDVAGVARAMVEHVLRFHSAGSRAAVFIFGRGDPPALPDAFQAAGFALVNRLRNMEFYALALARLPAAPAKQRKAAGTAGRRRGAARTRGRTRRRS